MPTQHELLEINAFAQIHDTPLKTLNDAISAPFVYNRELHTRMGSLSFVLTIARRQFAAFNPAVIPFLSDEQKEYEQKRLLVYLNALQAERTINEALGRKQTLKGLQDELAAVLLRLNALNPNPNETLSSIPIAAAWLAAQAIIEGVSLIEAPGKTTMARDILSQINAKRLYWVFTGGFLNSLVSYLPNLFGPARELISTPGAVPGVMSFTLYYTRWAIECGLILKHTVKNPWMTTAEKEADLSTSERFKTQWHARKYLFLNDLVWATANLLCYYWLIGSGSLGMAGNLLTGALFVFDTIVSIYRFFEESSLHNARLLKLNQEIEKLETACTTNNPLPTLLLHLKALKSDRAKEESEWAYKKYKLINDCAYSIGLMIAFSAWCAFFFPPAALAPAVFNLISFIGAASCFGMNLLYQISSGQIDLHKEKSTQRHALEEKKSLLQQFHQTEDPNIKRQLYLDIKGLEAQDAHQTRLIRYQKIELVRSVMMDALFPILMLTAGLSCSTGVGIALVACAIAVGFVVKKMIQQYEPKAPAHIAFDERAFVAFCKETLPHSEAPVMKDKALIAMPLNSPLELAKKDV